VALHRQEPPTGREHPAYLAQPGGQVAPVVHGRDRPEHRRAAVGQGQRLRGALQVGDPGGPPREPTRQAEHHRRRVDTGDTRAEPGGEPGCGPRTAPDVDHVVPRARPRELDRQAGVPRPSHGHSEPGDQTARTRATRVVRVVVRRGRRSCCRHRPDVDS
jgi:hypothetical protein